jgi:parvulin-like peptidyl-prolyl isomerase
MEKKTLILGFFFLASLFMYHAFPAEVIEEIVAKVNDDIITKSEFEKNESTLTSEIYANFTGEELDEKLKEAKEYLLYNLVNEKLLLQKAEQSFDMEKLGETLVKEFREQRNFTTTEAYNEFLEGMGMTEKQVKQEILKFQAPQMVLNSLVKDKIVVGNTEIESYYENNISEFTAPAKVTVREIVLKVTDGNREVMKQKREKIDNRLKGGDDFSELAKEYSDAGTKEKDGLLGTFVKGELAADLDAKAFELEEGGVSEWIETSYGYHLIKAEKVESEKVTPLEEVRFKISDKLSQRKYSKAVSELMTKMWEESEIEVNEKYESRLKVKH